MAKINKKLKRGRVYLKKSNKVPDPVAVSLQQNILNQARVAHQAGYLSQAEALYCQVLSTEPNSPDALHYLGMLAHQTGRSAMAVELIGKAIRGRSDYVNAYKNLGLILHDLGKLDEAAASFDRAISLKPDFVEAHYNLGYVMQDQGRLVEAADCFMRVLQLKPDYVNAHNDLGIILKEQGNLEEAAASFRRAISLKPDFADAHYNLGIILHDQGRLDEAAASFHRAITLKPAYVDAHYNLGIILHVQGRLDEAAARFRQAITLKPDFIEAYNNLGVVLNDLDRMEEAVSCFREAIRLKPDYAEAYNNLGNALDETDNLDEALASYREATRLKPSYAEAHYNLGFVFSQLGKNEEALSCYRKAIALKPDYMRPYIGLAETVKFTEFDADVQTMEKLYNNKRDLAVTDRIELGFVLGKVFADLKDYDKSFAYIRQANLLKRETYNYSMQQEQELFARIKGMFSSDFFAFHQSSGCQDETPIFILGMPRSGTTLVEQILASHPLVYGAGEVDALEEVTKGICSGKAKASFPECMAVLDDEALAAMGADYIRKIRKYSHPARYITDKLPHNFLRVGLIKAILPRAKVVHCMRDAMDTCFSIFKHDFKSRHGYAYDMGELGLYYNLYRDLMAHWETVLPGFIYNLKYEELVDSPQDQIRSLLDFCGLPWDEACLTFHKKERRVWTASLVQVRQPLFRDSVELWKRYEKDLEPLRKALYV